MNLHLASLTRFFFCITDPVFLSKAVVFPPGAPLESADLKIYHKGALRGRVTPADVLGLDFNTFAQEPVLFINILVDRLIHGHHAPYRVAGPNGPGARREEAIE